MEITSALLAAQNFRIITAVDELDEFFKEREAALAAFAGHAHVYESVMDLATTHCVEMAATPEPPQFLCPPVPWTPAVERAPNFDGEPNQRTIVRPEVTTRIGFR